MGKLSSSSSSSRRAEIDAFILKEVLAHPGDIARLTTEHFGISRQAVSRHLNRLVAEGKLVATGATRSRHYSPVLLVNEAFDFQVSPSLDEHDVWSTRVQPLLEGLPKEVVSICHYGFTEMLNNVVDHSGSETAYVVVQRSASLIRLVVIDRGVGIFKKISGALQLADERFAVLELSKGKLTTDPKRHSGEGIFFTSRMFDVFMIYSSGIDLFCQDGQSWLLDQREPWLPMEKALNKLKKSLSEGTYVYMQISPFSERTMTEVFDQYSDKENDYGFTRTRVPVSLARFGDENLVSRSQAKRLLARFDRFKEVVLDFAGVEMIGQAFADEIFRVFATEHSDVQLRYVNAGQQVEQMIRRALAARSS